MTDETKSDFSTEEKPKEIPKKGIMQFFEYSHLPEKLRRVSEPFGVLAHQIDDGLYESEEKQVALRKLLEAKDAAVRARLICGDQ